MPAPSTPVLFDGTTVTGLTNDPLHSGSAAFTVTGGVFVPHTYSEMWAASPTWAGDGEAYCDIATIGTAAGGGAFCAVIQQPSATVSTADGYQIGYLWGASPKIEVYKYTNVGFTTPFTTGIAALSAGDAIWVLVQAGTVYAYYRRSGTWTLAGSFADTTYTFSGGGAVAEWAVFDNNNVCRLDNLGGGSVSGATPVTVTPAAASVAFTATASAQAATAVTPAPSSTVFSSAAAATAQTAVAPAAATAAFTAAASVSTAAPVDLGTVTAAAVFTTASAPTATTVVAPSSAATAFSATTAVTASPVVAGSAATSFAATAAAVAPTVVTPAAASSVYGASAVVTTPGTPTASSRLPLIGVGT